jgi:hypothetical protein
MAFTENDSYLDYSGLVSEVAFALLGEPTTKHRGGLEWRNETYGSLSIDLQKNVYCDQEAGLGGGVRNLIGHETGGDHRGAVEWLGVGITSDTKRNWQATHCGGAHG